MGRTGLLATALVLSATAPGFAATIFNTYTTVHDKGTGFGSVINTLSLQNNGGESGSVLLDASGNAVLAGDAKTNSDAPTVAALSADGIDAGNLGIILNINEVGGEPDILLQSFTFRFYTNPADTAQYFDATYTAPGTGDSLIMVDNGSGGAGWLFTVSFTPAEAAAFFSNPNNRVGVIVPQDKPITLTSDGQENFYLQPTAPGGEAPEPASLSILALGAAALLTRRR